MRTLLLVAVVLGGCGDDGGISVTPDAGKQPDAAVDAVVNTCKGKTVYLNRLGATYQHGALDDAKTNTSLVLDMTRDLPPYPYNDASWTAVKACITTALAPFNATVTDVDPGTAQHHEIVFTTSYWGGGSGGTLYSLGSATCASGTVYQPLPANGVAFVFANAFGSGATRDQEICDAAVSQLASEVAGLDHVMDCRDYLDVFRASCGAKMFVDATLTCGDNVPRNCACGGTTQNTYQAVKSAFCN